MTSNQTRNDIHAWVSHHSIASFITLAYGLSWLAWLVPALGYQGIPGQVAYLAGAFGPAVAAAIITWYSGGSIGEWARSIVRWRVRPLWYLVVLGLPILLVGAASIGFALLGYPINPSLIPGRLAAYLPMLVYTAVLGGGNEEPGWRGFALPRLKERYSPVIATLLLGLVWAIWHLPLLWANPETQHGTASLLALIPVVLTSVVNIVSLACVYTWVYNRTGSVLLCILLHASINTANGLLIPLPIEAIRGDVYQTLNLVITGINVLIAIILVAVTRGMLGYEADKATNAEYGMAARTAMMVKGKAV